MNHETLILGIGNPLLTDEGAGIHALHLLQSAYPDIGPDIPYLTFLDGGTLSFTLASWIENCDNLIIFDAAQLSRPAGTVNTYVGSDMDEFLGSCKRSAHEVGLLDLMDIARLTEHLPENRALIGIQPETIDWGMSPTPCVQNALGQAVNEAVNLIKQWHKINADQDNSALNPYAEEISEALPVSGMKGIS
ncbi:MAG: HyaD/HybD family hydrogenase maturation endopeptidase [Gammaproteobacteria bacterium]|jgi:hydrogenase maturation protease|nr:HyaD/HybD family hydrogenase maturation endopeptidase [Gammaproteobacteria bacterium]